MGVGRGGGLLGQSPWPVPSTGSVRTEINCGVRTAWRRNTPLHPILPPPHLVTRSVENREGKQNFCLDFPLLGHLLTAQTWPWPSLWKSLPRCEPRLFVAEFFLLIRHKHFVSSLLFFTQHHYTLSGGWRFPFWPHSLSLLVRVVQICAEAVILSWLYLIILFSAGWFSLRIRIKSRVICQMVRADQESA